MLLQEREAPPHDRRAKPDVRRDVVILEGANPREPGFVTAIGRVRDESRRVVTVRGEVFRERGKRAVERLVPTDRHLMRPSSREHARVRGRGPRRGREGAVSHPRAA